MPRFQLLAPAKNVCGGGVLLAIFAWVTWAILFGTFFTLVKRGNTCDSECYETSPNPICWESNITNTTTLCYGAGNNCYENCYTPYDESLNATIVGENEAMCRELNNCDEIYAAEQLAVDECRINACEGVTKIPINQSVMIMVGSLLVLLSGTVCLNCYKEAATKPKCSPCKEAGGRICLYGSAIGASALIIFVIIQVVTFPTMIETGGGWADLVAVVFFIYTIAINAILVVCACVGRGLLAKEEGDVEEGMAVPVVEQTNPMLVTAVVE